MTHFWRRTFVTQLAAGLLATTVAAQEPPVLEPGPCPDGEAVLAAQTPADRALERRVEGALAAAPLDHMTDVHVVAIGSTVCLAGRAANPTDFHRAESTAAAVRGVTDVENHLRILLTE